MVQIPEICTRFAEILDGELSFKNGVCLVEKHRPYIQVSILGRSTHSSLALHSMWSFESLDQQGKALNLGETALLQEEVFPFTRYLLSNGIILTALHNHWLADQPHLIYAHYSAIEEPLTFARKIAEANKYLR